MSSNSGYGFRGRGMAPTDPDEQTAIERLSGKLSHLVIESDDISVNIANRILEAETVEDILNPREPLNAEDLAGAPFVLHGLAIMKSGLQGGIGWYALLDATAPETGEPMSITCGAANVIAQAAALHDKGFLPVTVTIEQSKRATARGYYPLSLRLWKPEEAF